MRQSGQYFQKSYTQHVSLNYLQYLPTGFGKDPARRWPLILYLHGGGERGDDLDLLKAHGIPRITEERDLPFITLSPQSPVNLRKSRPVPVVSQSP